MAEIWEYIANYNPQGFYEDNRSKMLSNDINTARLKAVNRENQMQDLILKLKQRVANGDNTALKELGIYSPETNKQYIENEDEMLKMARPYAQAILKMSPENREKGYQQMYKAISGSIDMSDAPAHYDEEFVTLIANSNPQKIHDDRLNEQAIERMNIQHTLNEDANENQLGRDLRKLQYAYDRANQKTKEGIDFITSQVREGNIDRNAAISAAGKLLGVDLAVKSDAEKLAEDYVTGRMTPEEEQAFLNRREALTRATSTKATGRTPAQELKDLYGAGYSPESILKFSQTGDVNDLEARPVQGGSIAADVQKYNVYNQEKSRLETQLGRPLDEKEDLSLQSKLGITSQELQNGKLAVQHGFKMDEINAQGQNAIKLEDTKQGNRKEMAGINQANAKEIEGLKQQYRVALRYIDDKISEGKELRELNNEKDLANYKNQLPTAHLLELGRIAEQLAAQGTPRTVDQLLVEEYENGLKVKQAELLYKQAQADKLAAEREKTLAELPSAGKTQLQQNAQWLVDNGVVQDLGEAVNMLNTKTKSLGKAGDVVNGVTLTGFPAYDEALLKKKAEEDAEDKKNQQFIEKQSVKLKPILENAYKAAQDGSGIGYIKGGVNKYVYATKQGAKNIAAINTLMNMVGPTMIAQLKAAGAGARSFDSEGERQTYLPNFSIYQDSDVLAATIKEFAEKMLGIKL